MAVAVDFRHFQPSDSREDLIRRIEQAPAEHAEAILAAYDVLQKLHEKNVLNLISGLLSAGDTVVDHLTDIISSKEATGALRIMLMFANILKSVDPDKLSAVINEAGKKEVSLLSIGKQAASKDARRALSTAVGLLNVLGEALEKQHSDNKH
jgi:uncharacterized protein YjgD (DUF1641 family)